MKIDLIIDGNNLAHEKFNLPNRHVPHAMVKRLIERLSIWARSMENCRVEVFFDALPQNPEATDHVRLNVAAPHSSADDDIVSEVIRLVKNQRNCVVVTEDRDLRERVHELGATSIRSHTFAKKSKTGQEFSFPDHLFDNGYFDRLPPPVATTNPPLPTRSEDVERPPDPPTKTPADPQTKPSKVEELEAVTAKIMVTINLENWPAQEGMQFLIQSACTRHRHRLEVLAADESLSPGPRLGKVFDLFIYLCSGEKDLVTRAGSLMDLVRLILIQKKTHSLEYSELESLVGIKTGFKSKLKKNSGKWVELVEG